MTIDYAEIEKALRKNGLAIMRRGNKDKLSMGRDGKTLVIYGNLIYSPARDTEYQSDNQWINRVVAQVKAKAQTMKEIPPGTGIKKSHHAPGEKTTGHHTTREKTTGHHTTKEPTTGHHHITTYAERSEKE